jgi:hypothetical protein
MKEFSRWRQATAACGGAALLAVAGCISVTEPPMTLFWTGAVEADAAAPFWISGTAEMVANPADSSVGLFLDADPEETVVVFWLVRNGPCSGSGERIAPEAAFPPITLAGSRGVGIASIRRRIPAGTYAAEVYGQADVAGDRLACAELRERAGP